MQILMLYNVPGECFKLLEAYKGPAAEQVVVPLQVATQLTLLHVSLPPLVLCSYMFPLRAPGVLFGGLDAYLTHTFHFCRSQNRFPCAADQYELVKEIGKGACGTVCFSKPHLD